MPLVENRLTDGVIAEFRSKVGTRLNIPWIHNDYASRATIKSFVDGVGDVNPLFQDEAYAKNTRYGCIIAPPSWIYSIFGPAVLTGMRGIHGFHSADDLECYLPILIGDSIRPVAILSNVEEKTGRFAGRMVLEYQDKEYYNQRDELVAKGQAMVIRTERTSAKERHKYSEIKLPHPWTEEELQGIEEEILSEEIRGSHVRYWEDIPSDEKLPPLVKGPLGLTDMIAFMIGAGVPIKAHGAAARMYSRNRAWGYRDPDDHSIESVVSVHYNKRAANAAGLAYPYDAGIQRNCWLIQFLTNWMGDEGWLKRCHTEYRKFVFFSDVVRFGGEVIGKYVDETNEHCVDIEIRAVNQRGENTTVSKATIILPSRENQSFPVAKRLPKSPAGGT